MRSTRAYTALIPLQANGCLHPEPAFPPRVLHFSAIHYSCMQTRFTEFNISEILKAGSMGHGTVVPGKYDIDLVMYSRGKTVHYMNTCYN